MDYRNLVARRQPLYAFEKARSRFFAFLASRPTKLQSINLLNFEFTRAKGMTTIAWVY